MGSGQSAGDAASRRPNRTRRPAKFVRKGRYTPQIPSSSRSSNQLQEMREKERQVMEQKQLVDRPDMQKNLKDAIVFIGTCTAMCPTFERIRRTYENNVKTLEKDPQTGKVTRQYAVKAFSRPAAGQPPPLPSDVRPPKTLVETLHYLVDSIVPQLPASHSFLWDRTRSIRQDFTYQNYTGDEAIECHELIARIHILTLHVMAGTDVEYSAQQEMEQLRKTLQSLSEFYNDNRKRGLPTSTREPEFRSYQLISHLRDPDVEYQIQLLPKPIFDDPHVQGALKLRGYLQQNNVADRGVINSENAANLFTVFFKEIRQTSVPTLLLCLLESTFSGVRANCLKAMARCYHARGKPYSVTRLTGMLGFDNDQQTLDFTSYYGLPASVDETGDPCVDLTAWSDSKFTSLAPKGQPFTQWIESRLTQWSSVIYNDPVWDGQARAVVAAKPAFSQSPFPTFGQSMGTQSQSVSKPPSFAQAQPNFQSAFSHPTGDSIPPFGQPAKLVASTSQSTFPLSPFKGEKGESQSSSVFGPKPEAEKPDSSKPLFSFASQPPLPGLATPAPPATSFTLTSIASSNLTVPKVEVKEREVPPKAKYSNADIESAVDRLIRTTVRTEIKTIVSQKARWLESVRQYRTFTIENISQQIFAEMMKSAIQRIVAESLALAMYDYHLKKLVVQKLIAAANYAELRATEKRNRFEEYQRVVQSLGTPKAHTMSRTVSKGASKTHRKVDQIKLIRETRDLSSQLWQPLPLDSLLEPLDDAFKRQASFEREVAIAIFCADWNSTSGVWMRKKLSLTWNGAPDSTFENIVKTRSTSVTLNALSDNVGAYLNVGMLIFECGVNSSEYDREALIAVLQRLEHNTLYKICISLVSWDRRDADMVFSSLEVDKLAETYGSFVDRFEFVQLGQRNNISMDLEAGLTDLVQVFSAELSPRGLEIRAEVAREKERALESELEEKKRQKEQEWQLKLQERYNLLDGYGSLQSFFSPLKPVTKRKRSSDQGIGRRPIPMYNSLKSRLDTLRLAESSKIIPKGIAELQQLLASIKQ